MKKHHKISSGLAVILATILFLVTGLAISAIRIIQYMEDYAVEMIGVVDNLEYNFSSDQVYSETHEIVSRAYYKGMTKLVKRTLEKMEFKETAEPFYAYDDLIRNATVLVYPKEGAKADSSFKREMYGDLYDEGIFCQNNMVFTYDTWSGGEFIISWLLGEDIYDVDLFAAAKQGQILTVRDTDTGMILESNALELVEMESTMDHFLEVDIQSEILGLDTEDNHRIYKYGFAVDAEKKYYIYDEMQDEFNNTKVYTVYTPLGEAFKDALHLIFSQLLLIALVYIIVVRYTRKLYRQRLSVTDVSENRKLIGRVTLDMRMISHISGLLIAGVLISVFLTLYLQTLVEYSTRNNEADRNLSLASRQVNAELKNSQRIEEYYEDIYLSIIQSLANIAVMDPSALENEQLLEFLKGSEASNIKLLVTDENGYCVSSSNDHTGFLIDNLSLYAEGAQELYNGSKASLTWDDGEYHYVAVLRKDKEGIICLQTYTGRYSDEDMNLCDIIIHTSFNKDDVYFVQLDQPDTLHYIENNSTYCQELPITLDESVMSGNFTGQLHLNGKWYYINELRTENVLYISASAEKVKWIYKLWGFVIELVSYAALGALLVLLFAFRISRRKKNEKVRKSALTAEQESSESTLDLPAEEEIPKEQKDLVSNESQMGNTFMDGTQMDEGEERINFQDLSKILSLNRLSDTMFRKTLNRMLIFTVVIIGIFIYIEMRYYSSTVFRYMFSSKWERKLNLFSVTLILLFALAAKILSSLCCRIVILIAKNIGPRGVTIGHMLCGLVKFGALVGWFFFMMVELGMKLSYLLTGAGIMGAVIGYACQQVINDLLSGLFLVFEGNFQVGDWISVGEWRGVVKEIGIRTTKVARGDDIRIYNNSLLNTVTVWSPTMAGALCFVSVDYGTDLDYVTNLILSNQENYCKVNPHIVKGPGVHGVTELGDNGITIRIWATVDDQAYVASVERSIRQETKRLFDENGVTIPFPQVVLHHGD